MSLSLEARSWEWIPSLDKDIAQKGVHQAQKGALDEERQEGQGCREATPADQEGKPLKGRTP
jgi:hypothetical protein